MAKVLRGVSLRTRRLRDDYPWKEWLNGKKYEAKRGEDFFNTAKAFRSILYLEAKERGLSVITNVVDDDTVRFQFLEE